MRRRRNVLPFLVPSCPNVAEALGFKVQHGHPCRRPGHKQYHHGKHHSKNTYQKMITVATQNSPPLAHSSCPIHVLNTPKEVKMNRKDKCVSERRPNNLTKGEQTCHRVRLTWSRALLWYASDHQARAIQGNIHTTAYDDTTHQQSQGELTQLTSSPAEAGHHHHHPLTETPAPAKKKNTSALK